MMLKLPGALTASRRRRVVISAVLALALVVGLAIFQYKRLVEEDQSKKSPNTAYSQKEFYEIEKQGIAASIEQKDYKNAIGNLHMAVLDAMALKKPQEAGALLKESLAKIPDEQVPWDTYELYADVAKALGDKALEKQALEKAVQKVNVNSFDAPAENIAALKKRLSSLK